MRERRLRRAEGRRARLHRQRRDEGAEDRRRARPHELQEGDAGEHLGEHLRERPRDRDRAHRARQDERRDDAGLVVARHRLRPRRAWSKSQTSGELALIRLVQTVFDWMKSSPNRISAMRDRVLGPLGMGDRAHERLVRIAHVRIDHLEMALVDGQVDRLADRSARMVDVRAHIGELHEIAEILDRAVAAALVEVVDEGRAVVRREDGRLAADLDAALADCGRPGCIARERSRSAARARPRESARACPSTSAPAPFRSSSARG